MSRTAISADFKGQLLLAMAIGLTAVWLTIWTAGFCLDATSWPARHNVSGMICTLAVGAAALYVQHLEQERRQFERYFAGFCQSQDHPVCPEAEQPAAAGEPASGPWRKIARQLGEQAQLMRQRVEEAEHARAALEVRLRRGTARHEQIEAILAGLSEPVLAVNQFNELVLANPAAERLFDLPTGDDERRPLSQMARCEPLVEVLREARRRRSAGARTIELELVDNHGQRRWYSVSARAIAMTTVSSSDESVAGHGAVAVLRDISGAKAMQKRNAEFVSAVSHEMKTPLAGIKAYLELLVDGDAEDEETREEFLLVINSQANRLQRLIDNLLNLARIEAGVVQVSKQSHSINDLLAETLDIVRPSAEAKQIALVADLSNLYLAASVDRDMIEQAAINLLSNAIKYTPEGGRVTLRSRLVDDRIQFSVQDSGVGLSPEDQVKVFEKFYRVKKDREMAAGTGLGLPLALHIVEDVHGGRLTVHSKLGQGSTFTVELPAAGQLQMV